MDGEIDPDELAALLADGDAPRVVDIRNPEPFEEAHVPGSENVPLGRLVQDVETFAGDEHVVTVCPHGLASVRAARLIAAYEGFDGRVESLRGGLEAWDGPIEGSTRESGATGGGETDGDEERTAPF